MKFDFKSILQVAFFNNRRAVRDVADRWKRAFRTNPRMAEDIIALGGLMERTTVNIENGSVHTDQVDPYAMAIAQGRRDLALELLALGRVDQTTLNELMEASHD